MLITDMISSVLKSSKLWLTVAVLQITLLSCIRCLAAHDAITLSLGRGTPYISERGLADASTDKATLPLLRRDASALSRPLFRRTTYPEDFWWITWQYWELKRGTLESLEALKVRQSKLTQTINHVKAFHVLFSGKLVNEETPLPESETKDKVLSEAKRDAWNIYRFGRVNEHPILEAIESGARPESWKNVTKALKKMQPETSVQSQESPKQSGQQEQLATAIEQGKGSASGILKTHKQDVHPEHGPEREKKDKKIEESKQTETPSLDQTEKEKHIPSQQTEKSKETQKLKSDPKKQAAADIGQAQKQKPLDDEHLKTPVNIQKKESNEQPTRTDVSSADQAEKRKQSQIQSTKEKESEENQPKEDAMKPGEENPSLAGVLSFGSGRIHEKPKHEEWLRKEIETEAAKKRKKMAKEQKKVGETSFQSDIDNLKSEEQAKNEATKEAKDTKQVEHTSTTAGKHLSKQESLTQQDILAKESESKSPRKDVPLKDVKNPDGNGEGAGSSMQGDARGLGSPRQKDLQQPDQRGSSSQRTDKQAAPLEEDPFQTVGGRHTKKPQTVQESWPQYGKGGRGFRGNALSYKKVLQSTPVPMLRNLGYSKPLPVQQQKEIQDHADDRQQVADKTGPKRMKEVADKVQSTLRQPKPLEQPNNDSKIGFHRSYSAGDLGAIREDAISQFQKIPLWKKEKLKKHPHTPEERKLLEETKKEGWYGWDGLERLGRAKSLRVQPDAATKIPNELARNQLKEGLKPSAQSPSKTLRPSKSLGDKSSRSNSNEQWYNDYWQLRRKVPHTPEEKRKLDELKRQKNPLKNLGKSQSARKEEHVRDLVPFVQLIKKETPSSRPLGKNSRVALTNSAKRVDQVFHGLISDHPENFEEFPGSDLEAIRTMMEQWGKKASSSSQKSKLAFLNGALLSEYRFLKAPAPERKTGIARQNAASHMLNTAVIVSSGVLYYDFSIKFADEALDTAIGKRLKRLNQ